MRRGPPGPWRAAALAALVAALPACTGEDAASAPRATLASAPSAPAIAGSPSASSTGIAPPPSVVAASDARDAVAGARVLVDLRQPPADDHVDDAAARRVLATLYPDGAPASAVVIDAAAGDFTGSGRRQRAWLVLPDGARAAQPDAMRALLAIDDGRGPPRRVPLAAPYLAIDAVARLDGEPVDVLLLRIAGMQMGHRFAAVHAVSVRDGEARIVERFPAALASGCGTSPDATVRAAVIVLADGRLQRRDHVAPCPAKGDPTLDAFAPAPPD